MMLLKYYLYLYIFTNENNNVMSLTERVIYTLDIYNIPLIMNLYSKWKIF